MKRTHDPAREPKGAIAHVWRIYSWLEDPAETANEERFRLPRTFDELTPGNDHFKAVVKAFTGYVERPEGDPRLANELRLLAQGGMRNRARRQELNRRAHLPYAEFRRKIRRLQREFDTESKRDRLRRYAAPMKSRSGRESAVDRQLRRSRQLKYDFGELVKIVHSAGNQFTVHTELAKLTPWSSRWSAAVERKMAESFHILAGSEAALRSCLRRSGSGSYTTNDSLFHDAIAEHDRSMALIGSHIESIGRHYVKYLRAVAVRRYSPSPELAQQIQLINQTSGIVSKILTSLGSICPPLIPIAATIDGLTAAGVTVAVRRKAERDLSLENLEDIAELSSKEVRGRSVAGHVGNAGSVVKWGAFLTKNVAKYVPVAGPVLSSTSETVALTAVTAVNGMSATAAGAADHRARHPNPERKKAHRAFLEQQIYGNRSASSGLEVLLKKHPETIEIDPVEEDCPVPDCAGNLVSVSRWWRVRKTDLLNPAEQVFVPERGAYVVRCPCEVRYSLIDSGGQEVDLNLALQWEQRVDGAVFEIDDHGPFMTSESWNGLTCWRFFQEDPRNGIPVSIHDTSINVARRWSDEHPLASYVTAYYDTLDQVVDYARSETVPVPARDEKILQQWLDFLKRECTDTGAERW